MLTRTRHDRLPVASSNYYRILALRVVATLPRWFRGGVAWDLAEDDPTTVKTCRDVAELVLRGAVPGKLSFERGLQDGLLTIMALDFGHLNGAARAFAGRLLQELR